MTISTAYPEVIDEAETLRMVLSGRSLARYGDGEFRLARGRDVPCERGSGLLTIRLRQILKDSGDCLVGIPNIRRTDNLKAHLWKSYVWAADMLESGRSYVSSFVSRPDSAHWINTTEYWSALDSLWAGKDVTLIRGETPQSLQPSDMASARSVREVVCPPQDAFAHCQRIVRVVGTPDLAVLCLGPTATVMAVDLADRGVHAVDAGHVGYFLRRFRAGQSMTSPEKLYPIRRGWR